MAPPSIEEFGRDVKPGLEFQGRSSSGDLFVGRGRIMGLGMSVVVIIRMICDQLKIVNSLSFQWTEIFRNFKEGKPKDAESLLEENRHYRCFIKQRPE